MLSRVRFDSSLHLYIIQACFVALLYTVWFDPFSRGSCLAAVRCVVTNHKTTVLVCHMPPVFSFIYFTISVHGLVSVA